MNGNNNICARKHKNETEVVKAMGMKTAEEQDLTIERLCI